VSERHHAHAGRGPVLVDVGDGWGALVLHAPPHMVGAEIEISPVEDDTRRGHVAVLARHDRGTIRYAAVYPSLSAGRYRLWQPDGKPTRDVDVHANTITEVAWENITTNPGRSPAER
jgi:hypothetical protein